jgi:anthranilate phosphoribosyltransferase
LHVTDPLETVIEGQDLDRSAAREAMNRIMDGELHPIRVGGLLAALRTKGVTVDEITGFAESMREHGALVDPDVSGRLVDTCGTGGAPVSTFNISTLSAFVAAGAGVPVAKHGNRAVTSKCGSADVLEALGADIELPPDEVERVVEEVGVGFLFAPTFHPAMKHAVEPRQELGVRTVFNVLGPLTNPAEARGQVLGVYDGDWVEPLARVLRNLGVDRALVVHGSDGLDEISPLGETAVAEVRDGDVDTRVLTPDVLDLPTHDAEAIAGKVPDEAARLFLDVLEGEPGAPRDTVLLNAAAAVVVGGEADSLQEGLEVAREAIDGGAARETLEAFVEATGGELEA